MKPRRKVCRACGVEKSARCFYRAKRNRDGRMNTCKVCHRKACAERWALKGAIVNEARRARWRADPELRAQHAVRNRRWQSSERGRRVMREARRVWKICHPEQAERIKRECWRRRNERRKQLRAEARA
jgi:hypothetical protein